MKKPSSIWWVALFRAINVGGKNKLPMAELRNALMIAGLAHVQTYIQSGNVIFKLKAASPESVSKLIRDAVEADFSFRPQVLVLPASDFLKRSIEHPFKDLTVDPKNFHLFFLDDPPLPEFVEQAAALTVPGERFAMGDRVAYLITPDGLSKSKLASRLEKKLGVFATARNYRTVEQLAEMLIANCQNCGSLRRSNPM